MYTLPDSTLQNAAAYKAAIDESAARNFGVYPNDPADMSVNVAAGAIFNGTTTTAYAAQAVGPITAPVTNPRIDRIILNLTTGVASVLAGSESATPSAPAITSGYISLAQITLATSTTGIDYTLIENEKPISNINNLTSPTINTPVIQGGTIGTTTPMTSAKVTQFNRYNTVTGVSLTSMARLCRIQLNAQADILQARIHLSLSSDHLYGDFVVTARQQAALNNNPVVTIKCISLNQVNHSGATSNRVRYDSLIAVYTLNASYTYVDIYVRNPANTTLSNKFDFVGYVSSVTGSPSITYYDSEALATPTADVTSSAAPGLVVYDALLSIGGDFSSQGYLVVQSLSSGYYMATLRVPFMTHSNASSRTSDAFITTAYRPTASMYNVYSLVESTSIHQAVMATNGALTINYVNFSGAAVSRTDTAFGFTLTWMVT